MYWVYILKCSDGSLYTGITTDVERRLAEHKSGLGAKYTRSHKPVGVVYRRKFTSRSAAQKSEAAIKRLTREEKIELINK